MKFLKLIVLTFVCASLNANVSEYKSAAEKRRYPYDATYKKPDTTKRDFLGDRKA